MHVLVRIADVFTTPQLELFVDPWRLFASERFALRGNWTFAAAILDTNEEAGEPGPNTKSSRQESHILSPSLLPADPRSAYYGQSFLGADSSNRNIGSPEKNYHYPTLAPHLQKHSVNMDPMTLRNVLPEQSHHLQHPHQIAMQHQQVAIAPPTELAFQSQDHPGAKNYALRVGQELRTWGTDYRSQTNSYYDWPTYDDNVSWGRGAHNSQDLYRLRPAMPQQLPHYTSSSNYAPLTIAIATSETGTQFEFSYKPLDTGDIRLLMLFPGEQDVPLRGVVYRCPLLVATGFQAISYRWESDDLTHSLWTPEGTIRLTASLDAALRCLRHENLPLVLWADGICVNQRDKDEKSFQIRLLAQVFQRATCVLVCLGSDKNSDCAMETLMQIRVYDALSKVGEEWPKDLAQVPAQWRKKNIPRADDPIWDDISALFERSWFTRSWIIQEVVVATSVRVVCGKWMIDWNDLFATIQIIDRESQALPNQVLAKAQRKFQRFLTLASLREREAQHDRRPLLELLEDFRDFEATKEHDRFFCLLGLAIDGNNPSFILDYNPRFDDVVRKYAWAFVKQGNVLDLLHRAGVGPRSTEHFPSWIPDWTVTKQSSLRTLAAWGMPCAASKHAEPRIDTSSVTNDMVLRLHGIKVDEIATISEFSNVAKDLGSHLSLDVKWKVPIANALTCKHNGLGMDESYAVLRDCLSSGLNISHTGEAKSSLEECLPPGAKGKDSLWAQAQNYYLALQGCVLGWKFIITKRKYAGLVPPSAKKGDLISVLNGGMIPFLLRSDGAPQGSFLLIGECYIDGLMKGEVENLGIPEEVISLG